MDLEHRSARTTIVVPGRRFGPQTPLLSFCSRAATDRGAAVRALTWDAEELRQAEQDDADPVDWVGTRVRALLPPQAGNPCLVMGKSMGSYAAAVAREHALPAVWLTPLLREPAVVTALERCTAPFLLIGGTADPEAWDTDVARRLTPHVLEVPDADHGLSVPGRLARSAHVLGQVATAVEDFLDHVVWPRPR